MSETEQSQLPAVRDALPRWALDPDRAQSARGIAEVPHGRGRQVRRPLSPLERKIVIMHLNGAPYAEIARATGRSPAGISHLLRSARVQEVRQEIDKLYTLEMAALMGPAIEAVRKNLSNPNPTTALKAADMVFQTQGAYRERDTGRAGTAEDVIQRALEVVQADGTQLRMVETRTPVAALEGIEND